jgi:hypothetical protein
MTNFVSVSTSAARLQDISLNPQKLAGQCAKLKCCMNYEVDTYVEAQKRLPSREIELQTKDGSFYFFKADILSNQISYSTDKNFAANIVTISGKRAFEIINLNRKGIKPDSLHESEKKPEPPKPIDLLEQESLTRFDKRKVGNDKNARRNENGNRNRPENRNRSEKVVRVSSENDNKNDGGNRNENRRRPEIRNRNENINKASKENVSKDDNENVSKIEGRNRNENGNANRNRRKRRPNNKPQQRDDKPQSEKE